jgi:hypothetical protein
MIINHYVGNITFMSFFAVARLHDLSVPSQLARDRFAAESVFRFR